MPGGDHGRPPPDPTFYPRMFESRMERKKEKGEKEWGTRGQGDGRGGECFKKAFFFSFLFNALTAFPTIISLIVIFFFFKIVQIFKILEIFKITNIKILKIFKITNIKIILNININRSDRNVKNKEVRVESVRCCLGAGPRGCWAGSC